MFEGLFRHFIHAMLWKTHINEIVWSMKDMIKRAIDGKEKLSL